MSTTPDLTTLPSALWRRRPDPSPLVNPVHVGIHLGRDREGRSVALPGPGPEGTRVAVLGESLFSRLFALRALAAGSRVTALSRSRRDWVDLRHASAGRLTVSATARQWPTGPPPTPVSVDDGPQTLVSDLTRPPVTAAAAGPWRTVLHVAPQPPRHSPLWSEADVVLVLGTPFATAVGRLLGQPAADLVASTKTGEVTVFRADGTVNLVQPDVSYAERALLTPDA